MDISDLKPGATVKGILPSGIVKLVNIEKVGRTSAEIFYRDNNGKTGSRQRASSARWRQQQRSARRWNGRGTDRAATATRQWQTAARTRPPIATTEWSTPHRRAGNNQRLGRNRQAPRTIWRSSRPRLQRPSAARRA